MHFDNIVIIGSEGFIGRNLKAYISNITNSRVTSYDAIQNVPNCKETVSTLSEVYNILIDKNKKSLVYYLANRYSPKDSLDNAEISVSENVIPLITFLENIKSNASNISFVFSSSAGTIYSEDDDYKSIESELSPRSIYAANKIAQEFYLDVYKNIYGLDVKIARISNPYGMGQRVSGGQGLIPAVIEALRDDSVFYIYGNGLEERDYIYIDDLCRGLFSLGLYKGEITRFNIASGEAMSTIEVIKSLESAYGKKLDIAYREAYKSSIKSIRFCIDSEVAALNWKPEVRFSDGIKSTVESYRNGRK